MRQDIEAIDPVKKISTSLTEGFNRHLATAQKQQKRDTYLSASADEGDNAYLTKYDVSIPKMHVF